MTVNVVVPTNPKTLKDIKSAIEEGATCLLRIDAEREALKDIISHIKDEFELPKPFISMMIKRAHLADFDKKSTEFDDFSALFEAVMKA